MPRKQSLAGFLRDRREAAELSQKEAGRRAGLGTARWSQIEQGEHPRAETLLRMMRTLDAKPEDVLVAFRLAGYDDLSGYFVRVGQSRRAEKSSSAEAGIRTDPTLSQADRTAVLDFIEGRRLLGKKRRRRN